MFESPFSSGLISKAAVKGLLKVNCHDIRKYSTDSHKSVDDYPFGGGPGMVLKPVSYTHLTLPTILLV